MPDYAWLSSNLSVNVLPGTRWPARPGKVYRLDMEVVSSHAQVSGKSQYVGVSLPIAILPPEPERAVPDQRFIG